MPAFVQWKTNQTHWLNFYHLSGKKDQNHWLKYVCQIWLNEKQIKHIDKIFLIYLEKKIKIID